MVNYKQCIVTKMLSHIEQHKEDLGAVDYSEMTAFLMAQFNKEMPMFKVTYAKLKRVGDTVRHVRKTKLACAVDSLHDIVVPVESECMHGIRFTQLDDGRTTVHFETERGCVQHKRTLIHMQRAA